MDASVVLVVADAADLGARAAARAAARARPDVDVRWVPGYAWDRTRWTHRVTSTGQASTRLVFPAGFGDPVADGDLALVWFRTTTSVPSALRTAAAADRDYASAEVQALTVSWLAALGARVVNAVTGDGPTGPTWSAIRWRAEARRAGLPVTDGVAATSARLVPGWSGSAWDARRPLDRTHDAVRRVLVAGRRAVGAADVAEARGCCALAEAARCRILSVGFDPGGGVVEAQPRAPVLSPDEIALAGTFLAEVA
ncbi:MAG: hypothetical protein HHJ14_12065 [Cellulomonas sp.]|nr:hypothetical protein [Cellulomonas sp.]